MLGDGIQVISRERLPLVLDVMRAVSSSLDLATLLPTIMERTTELVHADRSTFFVVDHARDELWSRVAQGLGTTEIRVPIEAGIAGHVARTGETLNIPDAYADARFNPEVDRRTGYRTRTILCVPVLGPDGRVEGVLQAINHADGPFGPADEALLQALGAQIAVALRNARLVEQVRRQSATNAVLLEVMRAVSAELEIDNLLPLIVAKTSQAMEAERSTIFLVDRRRGEIWSRVAQGLGAGLAEIRVPIGAGIAGHVARTGETINIPDAYADARFNPEVDRRTGYRTRTILCMPVRNDRAEIIGVVQVLNKIGGHFTTEDEELLQALTSQVSVALENAQLYEETVYLKNYNESILKSMATGVVAVDIEGVVTTLNPAAERIFGATGEAVGQPVAELLRPELNPALVEGLTEAIRAGEDYAAWELRYFTTPEDALNMNLSAHPLRDSKGATLGAVLVIEDITSEKRLMTTLCRYVAREVAEQVLADKDKLQLGGTYQDVTILCADIRDFTTISEQYEAKEIVDLLNGYFKFMFEAIHRYGGTIDKLIGDAILAVFGAPLQHADHAERAARAAIEMRRNLVRFNDLQRQAGRLTVNNGIGLSAGTVLVGNIGAEQRMDYTVIGDAVNVAARLEGLTKQYPTKIVLSGVVYEQIRERIPCLDLGLERVKGRQRAVHLYGIDDGAAQGDGAPLTAAATGT